MDEKILSFNENQLKRSGFAEAFTPELRAQMEQGIPEIQFKVQKEYEGDRFDATLHLKKSTISDYYILKSFDLQLRKNGIVSTVKQTFYLSQNNFGSTPIGSRHLRQENRFTLKEALNLLAGRSVFKNLINKEGRGQQAWVKLDFKNVLANGNQDIKYYHTNYGFDLAKVLPNYAIKEQLNENRKHSLIGSLQQGNLQKVTFVDKNGKEEKLYVSANIALGSLNVYDSDKQRLTTEILAQKQFVGKDVSKLIAEHLNQREKVIRSLVRQLDEPGKLHLKHSNVLKQVENKQHIVHSRKQKLR